HSEPQPVLGASGFRFSRRLVLLMPRSRAIEISGNNLTLEQFSRVVFNLEPVELAPGTGARMNRAHRVVESIASQERAVYGINTGFGKLSDARINRQQIEELQSNLVRSHACGVGEPLAEPEVRGMMLCRANALAKGYSGVRPKVVAMLLELLNRG